MSGLDHTPLETLRAAEGRALQYDPGESFPLELLEPLPQEAIDRLAARNPCPLPDSVRTLLEHTRGIQRGPLECVEFAGLGEFEGAELFPHGVDLAHDGFGSMVRDLREAVTGDGFSWGRYAPRTEVLRAGTAPVFAWEPRSRVRRFLDWLGWRG